MADTAATKEYDVTERAGKRVGGVIVERGKTVLLTDAQAEHGLAEGTIVPKGKELSKAFSEDTRATARMRTEAQAFRAKAAPPPAEAEAGDAPAADPAPAAPGVPAKAVAKAAAGPAA